MDNFCRCLLTSHTQHPLLRGFQHGKPDDAAPAFLRLGPVGFPLIYQSYGNKVMVYYLSYHVQYPISLFQLGIKAERGSSLS